MWVNVRKNKITQSTPHRNAEIFKFFCSGRKTRFFSATFSTKPQIMELTGLETQQIPHAENPV